MLGLFSQGYTPSIRSASGRSIAQLEKITLGGIPQWVAIRGTDTRNPILLHIHGGPGGSMDVGHLRKKHPRLESAFTVVTWNQRGAVKSYAGNIAPDSMTIDQFVSDAGELLRLLLKRLDQPKAFVMGHSIGSLFGLLLAHRHPELIHAYIGINQVVDRAEEERISYRTALELARAAGNRKAVADLERIGFPTEGLYRSTDDLVCQRTWLTKLGGVSRRPGDATAWHLSNLIASEISLADLGRISKGLGFSMAHLWSALTRVRLPETVAEVKVPVYFCMGLHDGITNLPLAEAYLRRLQAPRKELITFENSAHLTFVEEPEKFDQNMIEHVLAETVGGRNGCA